MQHYSIFPPPIPQNKKQKIPLDVTDCTFKAQTRQSSAFPVSYFNLLTYTVFHFMKLEDFA